MRYGSVCSGIEAATVAWRPLGWECAFVAEIDPFASAVLKRRLPDVPNLGDFTKIGSARDEGWGMRDGKEGNGELGMGNRKRGGCDVGEIDLLVGGSPFQSFSSGGSKGGIADPRGGLALEFARLALRSRSRLVVWENTYTTRILQMKSQTAPSRCPSIGKRSILLYYLPFPHQMLKVRIGTLNENQRKGKARLT